MTTAHTPLLEVRPRDTPRRRWIRVTCGCGGLRSPWRASLRTVAALHAAHIEEGQR